MNETTRNYLKMPISPLENRNPWEKKESQAKPRKSRGEKFGEEWERKQKQRHSRGTRARRDDKPRGGTNENKDDTVLRGGPSLFRKLARFVSLGDDNAEFPR